ncbi:hypothetical protein NUW58_g2891 [Xylaria curta]|uniref:Uncharacterized protein n=1 Tax=Xylaria curta TaxID=42375 RepID=A0ACC1PF83_9PEZI|nr:hypothetical protein NUW58_g2891 [Xylaria curta]
MHKQQLRDGVSERDQKFPIRVTDVIPVGVPAVGVATTGIHIAQDSVETTLLYIAKLVLRRRSTDVHTVSTKQLSAVSPQLHNYRGTGVGNPNLFSEKQRTAGAIPCITACYLGDLEPKGVGVLRLIRASSGVLSKHGLVQSQQHARRGPGKEQIFRQPARKPNQRETD